MAGPVAGATAAGTIRAGADDDAGVATDGLHTGHLQRRDQLVRAAGQAVAVGHGLEIGERDRRDDRNDEDHGQQLDEGITRGPGHPPWKDGPRSLVASVHCSHPRMSAIAP